MKKRFARRGPFAVGAEMRSPVVLFALTALGALSTAPGCNCGSSSGGAVDDGGAMDASSADGATDSPSGSDAEPGDSSTGPGDSGTGPADSSTGLDGSSVPTDSSIAPQDASDGAACGSHLSGGFSQALASATVPVVLTGNPSGHTLSMALDESDDPMFAYVDETTADGGVTGYAVMFTRWDACAGAFTAPIQVDTNHGGGDVAIAYDPSTHEVGIAYEKDATDNGWADSYGTIWLASMRAPATAFSLQMLNQPYTCCHGNGTLGDWPAGAPAIAMQGGHIYIAYETSIGGGADDEGLVWFLADSSTYEAPPTSADGTGEYEAGPPAADAGAPAHDFSYTAVPFDGTPPSTSVTAGYVYPVGASSTVSVATDSTGAPALAMYEGSGPGYANFRTLFWRPGMANAAVANEFTVDGSIDLALSFHGTSPVIAGHMVASATSDNMTVVSSADGTTWNAPVLLANGGTAFTTALAFDGHGNGAIASDTNASNPTCAANPYVAFSPDDGTTWTASCPGGPAQGFTTHSVNAAYGQGRLTGKLVVGFVNSAGGASAPTESGIVIWQSP